MGDKKLGQWIYRKRKEKGLTQEELGEMLHVSKQAVSQWEKGINNVDKSIIKSLILTLQDPDDKGRLPFYSNEPKQEDTMSSDIKKLTDITTAKECHNLCEKISSDFKKRYPDHKNIIYFLIDFMIRYAISAAIYEAEDNEYDDLDYATASCLVSDFLSESRYGRDTGCVYANEWSYQLFLLGGILMEDFPDPDWDEKKVNEFTNGRNGIGRFAYDSGCELKYLVIKEVPNEDIIAEEVKDNDIMMDFEMALFELQDLYSSYEPVSE